MSEAKGKTPAIAPEKVYEVVHSVKIMRDKAGVVLNRGDAIKASELAEGEAESFLAAGIIRDPEAPVTGSTSDLAHDRLLAIAQRLGLVTVSGTQYQLGEKKAKGLTAFRQAVSLDDLEAAIVGELAKAKTRATSAEGRAEAAEAKLADALAKKD